MSPDPGLLVAVAIGAGLGAALLLLLHALRSDASDSPGAVTARGPIARARDALVSVGRLRAVAALGAGLGVLMATHWPVAAFAAAGLVAAWPYLFGGAGAEQEAIARLEALVVWTESLRDTIAANASLEQAIAISTQRAPLLMRPALGRLAGQLRMQTPLDAALMDLAGDLDVPGADLVIAALVLNVRRRGDRLGQVLSGLCVAAREELDLRRRVNAGRAGLRRSVQIIEVITAAMAGYLSVFGGAFMRPYDRPAGQVALAVVVGMFAAGFAWMRHLGAEPDDTSFLTRPRRRPDPAQARIIAALTGISTPISPAAPGRGTR